MRRFDSEDETAIKSGHKFADQAAAMHGHIYSWAIFARNGFHFKWHTEKKQLENFDDVEQLS